MLVHPVLKVSTLTRALVGCVVAAALVVLTGCGFNAQTLRTYTPADGVNLTTNRSPDGQVLKVRNLMLLTDNAGTGFLSASLIVNQGTDSLESVEVTPLNTNLQPSGPAFPAHGSPVAIGAATLSVLTDLPAWSVANPALKPGGVAQLTLRFGKAGLHSIVVPIVSRTDPVFVTVSPKPPSPSAIS